MEQEELENRVKQIFEQQEFEVKKDVNSFTAEKGNNRFSIKVFSSEEYDYKEAIEQVEESEKVFVDEELSWLEDEISNEVSVIREEAKEEYETPSYEVIGDIAVINDLAGVDRNEAVEGILHHQNVKTILLKKDGLKGEYRVGDYEKLHGDETETIHTEFGCDYKVDPTKAFFSEREGTERKRVLEKVDNGERILVMFSGIGPYPILLARKKDVSVVGVEKNSEAVKYARENVEINDLEDCVKIVEGDVSDRVPSLGKFDRIIMPSPTNASEFLAEAIRASYSGTEIVIYGIGIKEEPFSGLIEKIRDVARTEGFDFSIEEKRVVSDYSPSQQKVAVRFVIEDIL